MSILKQIVSTFSVQDRPEKLCTPENLSLEEFHEVKLFASNNWSEMNADILEDYYEAVFWLTPEAFHYYLPGIMSVSIQNDVPNLLVNSLLINMLDRSPQPENWDSFFSERWLLLTKNECDVVINWLMWLSEHEDSGHSESSLSRAFDTMLLLAEKARS